MSSMFVFSCISGGYFVTQTAILTVLLESLEKSNKTNKKIDFYFGNSGGAISNLISLQYSKEKESIERVLYSLDDDIFIAQWVNPNVPFSSISSKLISLFKSSFYTEGKGNKKLLDTFFTERQLKGTEMWIGKFNIKKNKTDLLCTCDKTSSSLRQYINEAFMLDMSGVSQIEYAEGNKDKISQTLNATSCIPGIKPSIKINNQNYMDGGLGSSSTGSLMMNSILNYANANAKKYQFFYVIGPNYNSIKGDDDKSHWSQELVRAVDQLTRSMIYRERQHIFETWMKIIGVSNASSLTKITVKGEDNMKTFFNDHGDTKHFFCTCHTVNKKLNIVHFNKDKLKDILKDSYKNITFEIYYS